jgi:SAM-dependent methyltransferase
MKSSAKNNLRKFPLLVKIIRFVRQIYPAWKNISLAWEQEALHENILAQRQQIIDEYLATNQIKKLQIGAGTNPLTGWLNTDYEPTTNTMVFLNATKPFPFRDALFDYVFSEHMIEHISYKEGLFMMKEVFRVLKPGGKVWIATPDVKNIVGLFSLTKTPEQQKYIQWKVTENMGLYSQPKSLLQKRKPEWDISYDHIRR